MGKELNTKQLVDTTFWLKLISFRSNFFHLAKKLATTNSEQKKYFFGQKKCFFCFCMGRNQYRARRVYDLCVSYMMGAPEGSPKEVYTFVFCTNLIEKMDTNVYDTMKSKIYVDLRKRNQFPDA